jgi:two-component system, OmpR family, sensor histidine kinase CiaH
MFHSARLRLTIWFVLLILGLTTLVSAFVYLGINQELQHLEQLQQVIQYQNPEFLPTFDSDLSASHPVPVPQDEPGLRIKMIHTDVSAIRWRIISTMVLVNAGIAILIGVISYFLAGKTLKPIQTMMEEQRRFLADASHELRTPLTSLRTATEVSLRDKGLSLSEAKTLLKDNLEEVKNLQYLSEGLLRLSSLENHEARLVWQAVQVVEMVNEAVKKVTPQAKVKKIFLRSEVVNLTVKGDKLALIEVLVILLDNAIKYSPKNTEITVQAVKKKDTIVILVSDQGMGIESQDLSHIFDRFYRADQSRSTTFGSGYGLGLPIAQRIVEQHHGRIEVTSQPGKGSTFIVVLPKSRDR